jgi:hypothetical protein
MTFDSGSSQVKSKNHILSVLLDKTITGHTVLLERERGVGQDGGDDETTIFISSNTIIIFSST